MGRWRSVSNHCPSPGFAVVHVKAISEGAGQNATRRHEHGVGIDFEACSGFLEGMKTPREIQPKDSRAVCSDDPFVTARNKRRNQNFYQHGSKSNSVINQIYLLDEYI